MSHPTPLFSAGVVSGQSPHVPSSSDLRALRPGPAAAAAAGPNSPPRFSDPNGLHVQVILQTANTPWFPTGVDRKLMLKIAHAASTPASSASVQPVSELRTREAESFVLTAVKEACETFKIPKEKEKVRTHKHMYKKRGRSWQGFTEQEGRAYQALNRFRLLFSIHFRSNFLLFYYVFAILPAFFSPVFVFRFC